MFSNEPELKRSFHGSILPLVFGLPFAPGDLRCIL